MKKITLILMLSIGLCVHAQNYTFNQITATYADLTGTTSLNNGAIWDDPEYPLTLPFSININGVLINSFNVSDGFMVQNATTPILNVLAPFSMDLIDRGDGGTTSLSPISFKTDGTVGSRITKIEYKNCGSFYDDNLSMFINFQVWLYEGTNVIEYRYGPRSITSAAVFYDGDTGALIGLGASDANDNITNANFLTGAAASPTLSTSVNLIPITGTPPANTVYRFTPTTLSSESIQKSIVSVYPNPFNDKLVVEVLENDFSYSIYDIQGKEIQTETNKLKNDIIDTNLISSGIYFLKIVTENESITQKIIKK